MRNAIALARKELNVYFTTPLAYAMFAVMTVFASYFFIAAVKQFQLASMATLHNPESAAYLNLTDYVVAPMVFNSGIIVAMVAPFLSMRLIAEERRQRTFELLMTSPLRPLDIVLGKYLGGLVVMGVTIALTLIHPLVLHLFAGAAGTGGQGGVEWQTVASAYLGLFLWAAAAMSVGLFISALTDSQAVASIISFLLLLLLWLASWMSGGADGTMREVLTSLSASQHLFNFVKGVFDLKDVVYYLSWIVLGVFLTHRAVEAQRWA